MVNIKVSEKDAQYLTEALLFASGCDVCAEWDKKDIESIFELAYKLKKQNPKVHVKNVHIHNPYSTEEKKYLDQMTPKIVSTFPEILKKEII
jgi:hypothetical protein